MGRACLDPRALRRAKRFEPRHLGCHLEVSFHPRVGGGGRGCSLGSDGRR